MSEFTAVSLRLPQSRCPPPMFIPVNDLPEECPVTGEPVRRLSAAHIRALSDSTLSTVDCGRSSPRTRCSGRSLSSAAWCGLSKHTLGRCPACLPASSQRSSKGLGNNSPPQKKPSTATFAFLPGHRSLTLGFQYSAAVVGTKPGRSIAGGGRSDGLEGRYDATASATSTAAAAAVVGSNGELRELCRAALRPQVNKWA